MITGRLQTSKRKRLFNEKQIETSLTVFFKRFYFVPTPGMSLLPLATMAAVQITGNGNSDQRTSNEAPLTQVIFESRIDQVQSNSLCQADRVIPASQASNASDSDTNELQPQHPDVEGLPRQSSFACRLPGEQVALRLLAWANNATKPFEVSSP